MKRSENIIPFSVAVSTRKSPQSPMLLVERSKVIAISPKKLISGSPRFPITSPFCSSTKG